MDMNNYYIIGAVAAVAVAYFTWLLVYASKRKKRQLDKFHSTHSNKPLTSQQERTLVYGAILSLYRNEEILEITPQSSIDTYVYGLKGQWEIENREDAIDCINALLELSRSTELDAYLAHPSNDLDKIKKAIAKGLKIDLEEVEKTSSTYAWDLCRTVSLTKWCYWCGYITEDECWGIMNEAASKASQLGQNWTDYTVSFLLGRSMQGFDLDDLIIESEQLLSGKTMLGKKEYLEVYTKYSFK